MTTTDLNAPNEPEPTIVVLPSLNSSEPRELIVPLGNDLIAVQEVTE